MNSGEATNTNFIVFGLTRSGLEPMIYHTRGEHVNHDDKSTNQKQELPVMAMFVNGWELNAQSL